MLVPCLGRSSVQDPPLAAICPGISQTSPQWRAHSSRSPEYRRSCARDYRCWQSECSSPGCWERQEPAPVTLTPRGHLPAGDASRWRLGMRQRMGLQGCVVSEGGSIQGLPKPSLHVHNTLSTMCHRHDVHFFGDSATTCLLQVWRSKLCLASASFWVF